MKAYEIKAGDVHDGHYTVEKVFSNADVVLCHVRYVDGGQGVREFPADAEVPLTRPAR